MLRPPSLCGARSGRAHAHSRGRAARAHAEAGGPTRRELLIAAGGARRRRDADPRSGGGARVPDRKAAGPPADRDRRRRPRRPALRAHAVDPEPGRPGRLDRLRGAPDRAGGRCWTLRGLLRRRADHRARRLVPEQRPDRDPRLATRLGLEAGRRQRRRPAARRRGVLHRRPRVHLRRGERRLARRRLPGVPAGREGDATPRPATARLDRDVGARVARQHRDRRGQPLRQADDGQHRHRERRRPRRPVGARPDRAPDRQPALVAASTARRRRAVPRSSAATTSSCRG